MSVGLLKKVYRKKGIPQPIELCELVLGNLYRATPIMASLAPAAKYDGETWEWMIVSLKFNLYIFCFDYFR